jgi:hypothetical protein
MRHFCVLLIALAMVGCDSPSRQGANKPGTSSAAAPSLWGVSEMKDPMTDVSETMLDRASDDTYDAWVRGPEFGDLVVECAKNKVQHIYIALHGAASVEWGTDTHTISYRLDGAKPVKEHWTDSKNKEALFAPAPQRFLQSIEKAHSMLFEFDPFNTPTRATLKFDLDGLSAQLASVANCNR